VRTQRSIRSINARRDRRKKKGGGRRTLAATASSSRKNLGAAVADTFGSELLRMAGKRAFTTCAALCAPSRAATGYQHLDLWRGTHRRTTPVAAPLCSLRRRIDIAIKFSYSPQPTFTATTSSTFQPSAGSYTAPGWHLSTNSVSLPRRFARGTRRRYVLSLSLCWCRTGRAAVCAYFLNMAGVINRRLDISPCSSSSRIIVSQLSIMVYSDFHRRKISTTLCIKLPIYMAYSLRQNHVTLFKTHTWLPYMPFLISVQILLKENCLHSL